MRQRVIVADSVKLQLLSEMIQSESMAIVGKRW